MHCIHRTFVPTPSALTLFALTSFVPLIPLVPIIFQVRSHFHLPDRYSAPVPPDRAHRKLLCCIRSYIWGIWGHKDNPQEDLLHKAGSPVPGQIHAPALPETALCCKGGTADFRFENGWLAVLPQLYLRKIQQSGRPLPAPVPDLSLIHI